MALSKKNSVWGAFLDLCPLKCIFGMFILGHSALVEIFSIVYILCTYVIIYKKNFSFFIQ